MYKLRILEAATRDLRKLDSSVAKRVITKVTWLAENLNMSQPESLRGEFSDFFKLRVGDYRVFYEVLETEQTILIHKVGHRREVYKRR